MLPAVSLAMMVTLYTPSGAVSPGTNEKLKMSPTRLVRVNKTLLPSARVILANTVSTFVVMSVTLAVMLVMSVWLMMFGSAVRLITSGGVVSMVTFRSSVKLKLSALSNAVALKKYKPSGSPVKLMKLGLVLVMLSLIWSFVELNNRMVMLKRLVSVAVTFIGMFVCVCMVPDDSVGSTNAIAGSTVSKTIVLVSV